MKKKEAIKRRNEILSITQLIITADIALHKYSKLTIKEKIKLIRLLEKEKGKVGN